MRKVRDVFKCVTPRSERNERKWRTKKKEEMQSVAVFHLTISFTSKSSQQEREGERERSVKVPGEGSALNRRYYISNYLIWGWHNEEHSR